VVLIENRPPMPRATTRPQLQAASGSGLDERGGLGHDEHDRWISLPRWRDAAVAEVEAEVVVDYHHQTIEALKLSHDVRRR
jgi:hypothetical protein